MLITFQMLNLLIIVKIIHTINKLNSYLHLHDYIEMNPYTHTRRYALSIC